MSNPRGKKIKKICDKNQPDSDTELALWFGHGKQGRGENGDENGFSLGRSILTGWKPECVISA
jgi:hypothetical protein